MNTNSQQIDNLDSSTLVSTPNINISSVNEKTHTSFLLPRGIYLHLCPNCGNIIEDSRLLYRNACSVCMGTTSIVSIKDVTELSNYVKKPMGNLEKIFAVRKFVQELKNFFVKCVKSSPWSIQISWAIRLAQNQSFALIAPTGVGKTTFGLVAALYLSYKLSKKVYIVVPTQILVKQYEEKLREFSNRLNIMVRIIVLHSKLPQKKKEEYENEVRKGYFDVLITTSRYLMKNFDKLFNEFLSQGNKIDFIFVDDVDAVMRGSKTIEMILKLVGFDDKDIEIAYKLSTLRRRVLRCETVRESKKEEDKNTRTMCYENDKHVRDVFENLQQELLSKRKSKSGIIIISSATGRARGRRIRLFRELLGFNIGSTIEVYRNVVDTYMQIPSREEEVINVIADLINKLGDGCLIYVPIDKGLEYAYKLCNELKNRGINVEVFTSKKTGILEKFVSGELKALIGVATYYGLLVRGIDIPERIRYAIFIGVPRHKILLTRLEPDPQVMLRLLTVMLDVIKDSEQKDKAVKLVAQLRKIIRQTSLEKIKTLITKLTSHQPIENSLASAILDAYNFVSSLLLDRNIIEALKNHQKISVIEENSNLYVIIPDAPTYIQASGRTSRLFAGGITTGLSLILVDDIRLLNGLIDKVKYYIEDFSIAPLERIDIENIVKRINEDRTLVKLIKSGEIDLQKIANKSINIKTVLFVVESPNKARTIASFFGRPSLREIDGLKIYEVSMGDIHLLVTSTGGHVFEIVEEGLQEDSIYGIAVNRYDDKILFLPKYDYIKRCYVCGLQFVKGDTCPVCGSRKVKSTKSIVETLQKIAMEVDEVIIATDPDSEGEKIGYDIAISLAPFAKFITRAEFHEVTRKAVLNAIRNPREINMPLVEAQIVRRIEDRWLGFALSEYVTRILRSSKIDLVRDREGRLSAGRVQTPVLGRIIELYIKKFKTARKSKIFYIDSLGIEVPQRDIEKILGENAKRLSPSRVEIVFTPIRKIIETIYPLPPFTTDEMIAEAHKILKIDAARIMDIAQNLFELGFITYHRTDSTRISAAGISVAKEYLRTIYGDKIHEVFDPRTWEAGGAHEGIRPTKPVDSTKLKELIAEGVITIPTHFTNNHFKLYDLVFRRFVASQMKPGTVEKTCYKVSVYVDGNEVSSQNVELITNILQPGFLSIYTPIKIISMPSTTFSLRPTKIKTVVLSEFKLPNQGDLIKWMKEVGVGRPSTYARIVDILTRRGYAINSKGTLIPTIDGIYVYVLLAGSSFADEDMDSRIFLDVVKNIYKSRDLANTSKTINELLNRVKNEVKKMVSIKRTQELYTKMQDVEIGKIDYVDIIFELFKEICTYIILEHDKEGAKVCQITQKT